MSLASIDGRISAPEEALIPVTDEGLLRGDGAFEVTALYEGRPVSMEDHYARLRRTCDGLRLEVDWGALRSEVGALLAAVGPLNAQLRIVLTRGGRRIAIVEPKVRHAAVARVATVTFAPNRVTDGLKTLSYAANMLAGRVAKERGFDEALFVTPHGRVLEGNTWAFFWVDAEGALRTPPLSERILASITRTQLLEETDAQESVCTLDDVAVATEAFIASSVREVLPIAAVDDIVLPYAPGPVTQRASEALSQRIARELAAVAPPT